MNQVDFAQSDVATNTINDWVAKTTHDKIKDLIPQGVLGAKTRLVLTNAIYFKSGWMTPFEKSATSDAPFHADGKDAGKTPMMHMTHHFSYAEADGMQLVVLPYKSGALSMVVLLPKDADGLSALEKNLTADNLKAWMDKCGTAKVELTLPKFTFSSSFDLKDTLGSLGMADAFSKTQADFSAMTTKEKLYISDVVHKAFIAVDENGTEAAAATAIMMFGAAAMPRPEEIKVFNADHPFVFMIVNDQTSQILFMGRMADPAAN